MYPFPGNSGSGQWKSPISTSQGVSQHHQNEHHYLFSIRDQKNSSLPSGELLQVLRKETEHSSGTACWESPKIGKNSELFPPLLLLSPLQAQRRVAPQHWFIFNFPCSAELQNSLKLSSGFVWNLAQEMQSATVPSYWNHARRVWSTKIKINK